MCPFDAHVKEREAQNKPRIPASQTFNHCFSDWMIMRKILSHGKYIYILTYVYMGYKARNYNLHLLLTNYLGQIKGLLMRLKSVSTYKMFV